MDGHEYITGKLVEARIADLRAAAAHARLISTLREPRRPFRAVLGLMLIRLGSRIVAPGALAQKIHERSHGRDGSIDRERRSSFV
jgi:hypothetical protein